MLLRIFEIFMLVVGLYALVTGKGPGFFFGGRDTDVTGTPARLIGILLMVPLPLVLFTRFAMGLLMGQEGLEISEFCEISIDLIVMVIAFVAFRQTRRSRQPADQAAPPDPNQ